MPATAESTLPCGCATRDEEGPYCNADCGPPSCPDCCEYLPCSCDCGRTLRLYHDTLQAEAAEAKAKTLHAARASYPETRHLATDEAWRDIFVDDIDWYERLKAEHPETPDDGLPQWWEDPPDLDNLPPDPPALLARSDGKTLLPRDAFIEIFGSPSSGKSWLALAAIAANIRAGGRSLLWLWEGSYVAIYQRLRLLGVPITSPPTPTCCASPSARNTPPPQSPPAPDGSPTATTRSPSSTPPPKPAAPPTTPPKQPNGCTPT